ncbi:Radical SAM domain protein [Methanohalobium evestigatum Z-7303]|uniref:Radical SAM domain protein n=1 Tax=Methanohalobium evestigatum (strain ATCC BAA-1072 / DSM 3721 / NBRC 107634 / OCM 161 / Z-7303) TaxID=644295 RepID=D7E8K8_METEZ|nr:radical SAM protein [Methanohalobium evestigatum]ADI73550.1 Radical SAM domain protein [Methanohalobium evestigatum Z-7303]
MRVIYQPRGRAGEYCSFALNIYRGCSHGCKYCYAPAATRTSRRDFQNPVPRKDIIRHLKNDAEKNGYWIDKVLLSFISDPYQPIERELGLTRQAIEILNENNIPVRILTKSNLFLRDFDVLKGHPENEVGMTLAVRDESLRRQWEPNAPKYFDRFMALKEAHHRGIYTWVSLEPVIYPTETFQIIDDTHEFVDHYKVGKLNYWKSDVDWVEFRNSVSNYLQLKSCSYYIKQDLLEANQ